MASKTGWGEDGAWLPAELAAVRVPGRGAFVGGPCAFRVVYE